MKPAKEFRWTQGRTFLQQTLIDERQARNLRLLEIAGNFALATILLIGMLCALAA